MKGFYEMAYARPRRRVARSASPTRRKSAAPRARRSTGRASARRSSPKSMTVRVVVQSQNSPSLAPVTAQALKNARF